MNTLPSGSLLRNGDYKIIETIGDGGFGITYLAEQILMKRKVCIKEFYLKEYCERESETSRVTSVTQVVAEKMKLYIVCSN